MQHDKEINNQNSFWSCFEKLNQRASTIEKFRSTPITFTPNINKTPARFISSLTATLFCSYDNFLRLS